MGIPSIDMEVRSGSFSETFSIGFFFQTDRLLGTTRWLATDHGGEKLGHLGELTHFLPGNLW